jgi:hypothetical protein
MRINLGTDDEATNRQCLFDLRWTYPQVGRVRITRSKDNLLKDSYVWILDDPTFVDWRDNNDTQLLWIKGDPGKGKTMLMIVLIERATRAIEV